jgi:hypothetical protein
LIWENWVEDLKGLKHWVSKSTVETHQQTVPFMHSHLPPVWVSRPALHDMTYPRLWSTHYVALGVSCMLDSAQTGGREYGLRRGTPVAWPMRAFFQRRQIVTVKPRLPAIEGLSADTKVPTSPQRSGH